MKAMIFGCTGQDGSLLARSLLAEGVQVIGVSRSSNPNLSSHKKLKIEGAVELATANICNFREILELINNQQPDEIYNLAAQSSVALSFKQPVDTFNSIINGTVNLLEVARFASYDKPIYFAGSSEIFGDTLLPADIHSKRQPLSPYAIAKDASFNTVQVYRQAYGLRCITGILFNHESPYRAANFVTRKIVEGALRCKQEKDFRLQLGDLSVSRDWGWAEEYVEAMKLILRSEKQRDHVICTGRMVTLEYFVEHVFASLNLDWHNHVEIFNSLKRPSEIRISVGNPMHMKEDHGWLARQDVDGVIRLLIEHFSAI